MSVLPGMPLFVLVLLIGYVYADAKRRGMRYVMWTLLAIFIPNAIGIILYFVMRDPLLAALHALRRAGPAGLCILSEVRRVPGARLSAMPTRRGAGLVALRALRSVAVD